MQVNGKTIRRMCMLAGMTVMGAIATASMIPSDTQIMIDRALNSPTLTIRYSGTTASLVELRINGESIGTRTVLADKASGETNFNIDLSQLKDGDNEVEVRLFDKSGKLVGSDKTNISTDQSDKGPVYLKTPAVGATVQGPIEINLGFGKEMKNVYVSFFVDSDFKKMSNYPPYTYMWDTSTETNGWHEVEAWVIDESSTTYKTRKTRVFINNPGGRTNRVEARPTMMPKANPIRTTVVGVEAGTKTLAVKTGGVTVATNMNGKAPAAAKAIAAKPVITNTVVAPVVAPVVVAPLVLATTANVVKASPTGGMSGVKPMTTTNVLATGVKTVMPGTAVTVAAKVPTPRMVNIVKGQRLPNLSTFAVILNSQVVAFDVAPRVDEGVPMAPFRYLMEKSGGTVNWHNQDKSLVAKGDGHNISMKIGDSFAKINDLSVTLERAPYIDGGRTIVPLSFLRDALNVNIEFDRETSHVLITSTNK